MAVARADPAGRQVSRQLQDAAEKLQLLSEGTAAPVEEESAVEYEEEWSADTPSKVDIGWTRNRLSK